MDKIYQQAKDKNIAAVVIYGKPGESSPVAYKDAERSDKFKTSELKDAFLKGAVVQINLNEYLIPISFAISSDIGTVTYAKAGSTTGTAATGTLTAVKD